MRIFVVAWLAGVVAGAPALAQEVWPGYAAAFTKPDGADWTLPEHQDRITPGVWITRGSSGGLFNIAAEPGYTPASPAGTEWAIGTTAEYESLEYMSWRDAVMMCPPCVIGTPMGVHLISEDIYIDIRMTAWSQGAGGGFAYERGSGPVGCNGADVAEPIGSLDFGDVVEFLALFAAGESAADLAAPIGQLDFSDVVAFLTLFAGGCP